MTYDFRKRQAGERDFTDNFEAMVRDIDDKARKAKGAAATKVLKVVKDLLTNFGLTLDLKKSWIDRYDVGSDSHGISGGLYVTGDLEEDGIKDAIWDVCGGLKVKVRKDGAGFMCEFDIGG
jgi:hypothetical protein